MQNDPDKQLGRIASALVARDVGLDFHDSTTDLPAAAEYDGLVVLPGLADPVDDRPEIHRVRRVIVEALESGLPVLGLCLGGQLLVQTLGGSVYPCRPELGFRNVEATQAVAEDPLLDRVPARFLAFHAHTFAFRPPSSAVVLLENEVCVQACRLDGAWAFQFHPEATRAWVGELAAAIRGTGTGVLPATAGFFRSQAIDPDQLERDAATVDETLGRIAEGIASGFAARCEAMTRASN